MKDEQHASLIKYVRILATILTDLRSKYGLGSPHGGLGGSDVDHAIAMSHELLARLAEIEHLAQSRSAALEASDIATLVADIRKDPGGPQSAAVLKRQELNRILEIDQSYWRSYDAAVLGKAAETTAAKGNTDEAQLDRERLLDFLRTTFPAERRVSICDVKVMSLGYSKKTFLIKLANSSLLPHELIVRADQRAHYLATTVIDEYPLLQVLSKNGVPVPQPYALEDSGKVLGTPFIVVSRNAGATAGDFFFAPPANRQLTASTARALARVHNVPLAALEKAGLSVDDAYTERELETLRRTWHDLADECPTIDLAVAWLKEHLELARGLNTLVHYDFCYNNLLIEDGEVTSILDWEFAHIGNPAADLGYYKYAAERMSGFEVFKLDYADAGRPVPPDDQIDFYYMWGLTRFAVMLFQAKRKFEADSHGEMRWALAPVYYLRRPILAIGQELERVFSRVRLDS